MKPGKLLAKLPLELMKINKMKHYILLLITVVSTSLFAQDSVIRFIDTTIEIDGEIDENVWQQVPGYTNFYNYLPTDEGIAENQTSVKLFHNGVYLFVSAIYNDTTEKTQVSTLKRDVPIGLSDGFVLVLDTQNQEQNASFFALNSLGNQTDGLIGRNSEGYAMNFNWNTVWKSQALLNGTKKQYEMAIPLKSLNYNTNNAVFGVQFYVRDIKNNSWTIFKNVKRNYSNFDLRFTEKFIVENLPNKAPSKFTVTPSITTNYQKDILEDEEIKTFTPSLDVQYNVTSSLKLDLTINPDFSQIDVDQQVTNLSRFSIFFPEQRNFFLENSDLFSSLGVFGVNPFYSRRIGAGSGIQFGVKLSGNVAPKTRIGLLNVQTSKEEEIASQNYGVLVTEQQVTKNITTTGYFINRQETDKLEFIDDYNRVAGLNLRYTSENNKWIGEANYSTSFSDGISKNTSFYNTGISYNKRGLNWNTSIKKVEENYTTDVGFTPRLFNYDAINDVQIREGYIQTSSGIEYEAFYKTSNLINSIRFANYGLNNYFDESGRLTQSQNFFNSAIFFKNLSAVYFVLNYDYIDLKYGFDPLGNGNSLIPDIYRFGILKIGYNSANNQAFRYRVNLQRGTYYNGQRTAGGAYLNYQLLPFANVELSYDVNSIDLPELGKETFHLARFTGQVFFSNRINWTTYVQYNTQGDNFNINSRLQWEYKPLSYVYLVVTNNYNKRIESENWGVAFKINYRLDF